MFYVKRNLSHLLYPASLPELFFPSLVATDKSTGGVVTVGKDCLRPTTRRTSKLIHPIRPTNKVDKVTSLAHFTNLNDWKNLTTSYYIYSRVPNLITIHPEKIITVSHRLTISPCINFQNVIVLSLITVAPCKLNKN